MFKVPDFADIPIYVMDEPMRWSLKFIALAPPLMKENAELYL